MLPFFLVALICGKKTKQKKKQEPIRNEGTLFIVGLNNAKKKNKG